MKIINHLYDNKKYIHLCEGSRIHENSPDTYLVWTKCGIDVPAGESFKSDECITCPDCCILIRNRYMDTAEFKVEYEAWLDDLKDELEKLP